MTSWISLPVLEMPPKSGALANLLLVKSHLLQSVAFFACRASHGHRVATVDIERSESMDILTDAGFLWLPQPVQQ